MHLRNLPHLMQAACTVVALVFTSAASAQTTADSPVHNAGILLTKTNLYDVTSSAEQDQWCFDQSGRSQAHINIVWRVGAEDDIGGFSAAYQRHLTAIWREIGKQCAGLDSAYIANYVAGVRLRRSGGDEVAEDVALPKNGETSLSLLLVTRDANGRFAVEVTRGAPGYTTLASARKFRGTKDLVALPPGHPMGAANETASNVGLGVRSTTPAWVLPGRDPLSARKSGASTLVTTGLGFPDIYQNIYLGRFDDLRADRRLSGDLFQYMFAYAASAYGEICAQDIAADSPTIVVTRITTNGFGGTIDERKAKYLIDTRFAEKADQYGVPFHRDPVGRDLEGLIHRNGCVDAQMIQFLENLLRYAYAKPPVQQLKPQPIARYRRIRDVRSGYNAAPSAESVMLQMAVNLDMEHRYPDSSYYPQQRMSEERAVYDKEVPLDLEVKRMLVMSCTYRRADGRHSLPYVFWKNPKPAFVSEAWRKGLSPTNPYRHIGDPRAECPPQEPAAPFRPHPADVLAHLPLPDEFYEPPPKPAVAPPESAPSRGARAEQPAPMPPASSRYRQTTPATTPAAPPAAVPSPAPVPAPEPPASSGSAEVYAVGDTINVQWSGRWYPAKILERKGDRYKISYVGYASNWDEWVTTARMRKR
jgi:hypothetical protein